MDNLITLIFIIIAVLSLLGKIQPKKKPGTEPSKAGNWLAKLNAYLADLQNKIEQQAKTSTPNSSGWDELMNDGTEADGAYDADEYSLEDLELEEDQSHLAMEKASPTPTSVSLQAKPLDRVTATPEMFQQPALRAASKSISSSAAISRQDLRHAVMWSEILGPPVALRDQTRRMP